MYLFAPQIIICEYDSRDLGMVSLKTLQISFSNFIHVVERLENPQVAPDSTTRCLKASQKYIIVVFFVNGTFRVNFNRCVYRCVAQSRQKKKGPQVQPFGSA